MNRFYTAEEHNNYNGYYNSCSSDYSNDYDNTNGYDCNYNNSYDSSYINGSGYDSGYDNGYSNDGFGTNNGNGNNNSNNGGGNGNNGGGNSNGGNSMDCRFTNTATAKGYLEAVGTGNPTMVSGEDSVTLSCIFADIIKTADRESVAAGDRVRYTITFRNMSNREMYNVKITDNLSRYLNPIATTIMPAPRPGESLENGITLGRVAANSERTLTYTAVVTDDVNEDVVNRAFADFSFRGADGTEQTASTHITSLTLPVENQGITVTKTADKSYITSRDDTVVFTIRVHNNSSRELHDLVVSDRLPNGMGYVENSTVIDNNPAIDADPADGIYIGTLASGGNATVKFSARVNMD
ncbi:MAG: DUF11 domain-containing protein [Ruminococcaceae bacterium]|nr:DUF11 domain-containing protein [Oscillospiraceae bacterium]